MSFMKDYKKDLEKRKDKADILTELGPPDYYANAGNYSLNKLVTGHFEGALPQGRLVCITGHSSSGKSLVAGSCLAQMVRDGGFGFCIDSENALDDEYLSACGLDVDNPHYQYIGVKKISQVTSEVNNILKMYKTTGEKTRGVILIDSLDMLLTDTEETNINKGIMKGDQGQQAKQLKAMLKTFVHGLKGLPVTIVCTKQVYVEQDDKKSMNEPWKFTESLKFAFTHIIMVEKLVFKKEVDGTNTHQGFTMKARTYKSRRGRENQVIKLEIPYDKGMDPYSGLLEIAEEFGVVTKGGSWFTPVSYEGKKFQKGTAEKEKGLMDNLLAEIIKVNTEDMSVNANLDEYISVEADESDSAPTEKTDDEIKEGLQNKRKKKASKKAVDNDA